MIPATPARSLRAAPAKNDRPGRVVAEEEAWP